MKQTQQIKPPIPHGSHVACSTSLTKLTALQAPIAILLCTPDLDCTGGNNDIDAGTDTEFVGVCTPALTSKKNAMGHASAWVRGLCAANRGRDSSGRGVVPQEGTHWTCSH